MFCVTDVASSASFVASRVLDSAVLRVNSAPFSREGCVNFAVSRLASLEEARRGWEGAERKSCRFV